MLTKESKSLLVQLLRGELDQTRGTLLFYEHQKSLPTPLRIIDSNIDIEANLPNLRLMVAKEEKAMEELQSIKIKEE